MRCFEWWVDWWDVHEALKALILVYFLLEITLLVLPFSLFPLAYIMYMILNVRVGEIVRIIRPESYYLKGKGVIPVDYGKVKTIRRFADVYVLDPIVYGCVASAYTYQKERMDIKKLSKKEKMKFYLDSL